MGNGSDGVWLRPNRLHRQNKGDVVAVLATGVERCKSTERQVDLMRKLGLHLPWSAYSMCIDGKVLRPIDRRIATRVRTRVRVPWYSSTRSSAAQPRNQRPQLKKLSRGDYVIPVVTYENGLPLCVFIEFHPLIDRSGVAHACAVRQCSVASLPKNEIRRAKRAAAPQQLNHRTLG